MAKKQVKCPNCKEEITELIAYSSIASTLSLDGNEPDYQGQDYCEGYYEYDCPECNETVATTEREAIRILKGA